MSQIKLTNAQMNALKLLKEHRIRTEKHNPSGWMLIDHWTGIRATTLYAIQRKTQYPFPQDIEVAFPPMTIEAPYNPDMLVGLQFRKGQLFAHITEKGMEFLS